MPISIKMCYLCADKTQGRSLFVYTLCVSTMYSIVYIHKFIKYVEVCKNMYVMYVLALSD